MLSHKPVPAQGGNPAIRSSARRDPPAPRRRRLPRLADALLVIVLLELFLLGSGRMVQIGPLTLRMLLYAGGIAYALIYYAWRGSADRNVVALALAFVSLHVFSMLFGIMRGANLGFIMEDLKPLSFFLALLFLSATIRSVRHVHLVVRLIKISALIMAAGYFIILALVWSGLVPFVPLYIMLMGMGEFIFRGDTGVFVYKGFLYLGVGFFFLVMDQRRHQKLLSIAVMLALVLTFTRGFLLSLFIVSLAALFVAERRKHRSMLYATAVIVALVAVLPWFMSGLVDRTDADSLRLFDLRYVLSNVTWYSVLIGHGFGAPIGERLRIEATYLEILHKQGILGLVFWGTLCVLVLQRYLAAVRNGFRPIALPFLLSTLFILIQSATNPFLTNPIGMSMVLVSLVALGVLARSREENDAASMRESLGGRRFQRFAAPAPLQPSGARHQVAEC